MISWACQEANFQFKSNGDTKKPKRPGIQDIPEVTGPSRRIKASYLCKFSLLLFFLPLQRPHHAHALFDFTPHHPTQLRFLRGDVIELLDCSDSMRWRGRCHGHVGYFPPEYVQPIYQCQWPDASDQYASVPTDSGRLRPAPFALPSCSAPTHKMSGAANGLWANCLQCYWLPPVMPPVSHKPHPVSFSGAIGHFRLSPQQLHISFKMSKNIKYGPRHCGQLTDITAKHTFHSMTVQ